MAFSFSHALRSVWHTMTSYDRHATIDSPYRTGRHTPLNRNSVLTSVATASESRTNIASPYLDENGSSQFNGAGSVSPYAPSSPAPYSPGMRSQSARRQSQADGFETQSSGDVPMQSFQDGLPPPPPVSHSWRKIDAWAEEHYPELYDQLCEGATHNDLNELEHQLDCSLPQDVRESLMIHDGQERWGTPTGIIFGSMLLDCEELVQEWETWRKVNQQYLLDTVGPSKSPGSSSQASSSTAPPRSTGPNNPEWRQDLLSRQDSMPPGAIQKAYAHPGWIPLVRDWGGNNLAVDLAPGPNGKWGQIILFGRDYDTKYVVARSWAHFLAIVADDLNSGKWFVDEETHELKLREFKETRVEPPYFSILRWRMDQKHGRTAAKRRSRVPPPNRTASPAGSGPSSPYAGPADPSNPEPRGRSMQRLSGSSPLASPRPGLGKPSPLARVTEETSLPELEDGTLKPPNLVELETPRPSEDNGKQNPSQTSLLPGSKSNKDKDKTIASPPPSEDKGTEAAPEPMKEIEI